MAADPRTAATPPFPRRRGQDACARRVRYHGPSATGRTGGAGAQWCSIRTPRRRGVERRAKRRGCPGRPGLKDARRRSASASPRASEVAASHAPFRRGPARRHRRREPARPRAAGAVAHGVGSRAPSQHRARPRRRRRARRSGSSSRAIHRPPARRAASRRPADRSLYRRRPRVRRSGRRRLARPVAATAPTPIITPTEVQTSVIRWCASASSAMERERRPARSSMVATPRFTTDATAEMADAEAAGRGRLASSSSGPRRSRRWLAAAKQDQRTLEAAGEVLGLAVPVGVLLVGRAHGDGEHRERPITAAARFTKRLQRVRQQPHRAGEQPGARVLSEIVATAAATDSHSRRRSALCACVYGTARRPTGRAARNRASPSADRPRGTRGRSRGRTTPTGRRGTS